MKRIVHDAEYVVPWYTQLQQWVDTSEHEISDGARTSLRPQSTRGARAHRRDPKMHNLFLLGHEAHQCHQVHESQN